MNIINTEGFSSLYRGFRPAIIGTVPGVGLYFVSYQLSKDLVESMTKSKSFMIDFTAGLAAEAVSCVVWVPTDVLKERAQATGIKGSISQIIRQDGFRGLYKGYGATLASFGPFSAFYFMFVEQLKGGIRAYRGKNDLDLIELIPACSIAGGASAFITAPLDLVKTRMQVERKGDYDGVIRGLSRIWRNDGFRGLFRGGASRVWFAVPNTAITMSLMESIQQRL